MSGVELGDTLYHETRHAEQWFLMARRDADAGLTAPQIQSQLGVPPRVAQAAVANPIPATDARRSCADAMYNSVYGTNAAPATRRLATWGPKAPRSPRPIKRWPRPLRRATCSQPRLAQRPNRLQAPTILSIRLMRRRRRSTPPSRPRMPPTVRFPRRRMPGTPERARRPR